MKENISDSDNERERIKIQTFKEPSGNQQAEQQQLTDETARKASNDSTHEGSICGKKTKGQKFVENSGNKVDQIFNANKTVLKDLSAKELKTMTNFDILVQVSKFHTKMLKYHEDNKEKCELNKISSVLKTQDYDFNLIGRNPSLINFTELLNNRGFNSHFSNLEKFNTFNHQLGYYNLN